MATVNKPKIELVEESVSVSAERVTTGRVRVSTETEFFEETAHASLGGERVEVSRIPIDQEVKTAPQVRVEGDVTIIPVLEEIVVVEKKVDAGRGNSHPQGRNDRRRVRSGHPS